MRAARERRSVSARRSPVPRRARPLGVGPWRSPPGPLMETSVSTPGRLRTMNDHLGAVGLQRGHLVGQGRRFDGHHGLRHGCVCAEESITAPGSATDDIEWMPLPLTPPSMHLRSRIGWGEEPGTALLAADAAATGTPAERSMIDAHRCRCPQWRCAGRRRPFGHPNCGRHRSTHLGRRCCVCRECGIADGLDRRGLLSPACWKSCRAWSWLEPGFRPARERQPLWGPWTAATVPLRNRRSLRPVRIAETSEPAWRYRPRRRPSPGRPCGIPTRVDRQPARR